MSHPVCFRVHETVLQFCLLLPIYPTCDCSYFPRFVPGLSCATLSWVGLFEVPILCLGSHDFSLDLGSVLLNDHPLEQLMLRGGGPECATCLACSCTLSMTCALCLPDATE
jgi:hypothetical protein